MNNYRSVTICVHQLPEGCMFFDLELDYGIVLTKNFKIDVLTLSLKKQGKYG